MSSSKRQSRVLRFSAPDLVERRGEASLLVWGGVAQWLVVDAELQAFLELFDGKRTLRQVQLRHARRRGREVKEVEAETGGLIEDLCRRGVLRPRVASAPGAPQEPLQIANVTVNLTNRCNLRCRWCYNETPRHGAASEELEPGALMDAVEAARPVLSPDATFIVLGGEPTLQPQRLLTAVERAERIFSGPTLISTNGTLLSEELVGRLARQRVELQVSLDSHRADHHDALRGVGSFERAVGGIRRLVSAGIHTIISLVYARESLDELEPYLDLARELGVNEARFIPMRMIGRGDACREASPDQAATFERLLEILDRRPELRPLLARDYFSIFMSVCRFSAPRTGCGVGRRVIFIDADGSVYPCPNHVAPEHHCGDLRQTSLEQIIRAAPVMEQARATYQVDRYDGCSACAFRYWCAGDCRGEVLSLTGNPAACSPHCEELQRVFVRMLWLIAEGDQRLGAQATHPDGKAAADAFRS